MILKFILLGSMCYNIEINHICREFIKDPLLSDSQCSSAADDIGRASRDKIEEIGGSLLYYEVHCIAIDKQGYNVDHSFKVSYNIL